MTALWRFDKRTLKRAVADATEAAIRQHQLPGQGARRA